MTLNILWRALLFLWTASEIGILLFTRTRRGDGKIQDRGSLHILWPTIVLSIWLGTWFGGAHPHTIDGGRWLAPLVLTLFLAGLIIRWTAIVTLGKSFSANVAIHATQTIRKTAVFRFVRHPSYTGMLLIFAAIGLTTRNWIGLAIVVLPTTAALLYRIHVEEAALREAFGTEYIDYSRATRRLLPGLY